MADVLVTGASGRVGKHLLEALVKKGDNVRVLATNKSVEIKGVEVFYGNLLDVESLLQATLGTETIFHLAAVVDYLSPKKAMYNVNVIGTRNLLKASKGKRFIFLSSTAAMGKKLAENPATEKTSCYPSNFYGQTKLAAEKLVKKSGGIIIRSADIMGPGFFEGYDYVLSQMAENKMIIPGNGQNVIQWIHITDLIQALLLAKEKGKSGEIYLVTGKEARTLNECLILLGKYLNVEPPTKGVSKNMALIIANYRSLKARLQQEKPLPFKEFIEKMTANRRFNISKAINELGFAPSVDLDAVANEMVIEYKRRRK
jgi:nucleoside-diphosphate-sugar epimerase